DRLRLMPAGDVDGSGDRPDRDAWGLLFVGRWIAMRGVDGGVDLAGPAAKFKAVAAGARDVDCPKPVRHRPHQNLPLVPDVDRIRAVPVHTSEAGRVVAIVPEHYANHVRILRSDGGPPRIVFSAQVVDNIGMLRGNVVLLPGILDDVVQLQLLRIAIER